MATSKQIQEFKVRAHPEVAFHVQQAMWLKEIAYQLAVMNEQNAAKEVFIGQEITCQLAVMNEREERSRNKTGGGQ